MTGRAAGRCCGGSTGQHEKRTKGGHRHGLGRGQGRGRHGAVGAPRHADSAFEYAETNAPLGEEEQRQALKAERNRLKAMLREVEDKLRESNVPETPTADQSQ
ncbi:MAG: DUF5320 family protein [Rhodospirillales bacterium]|nr:DUF5320 family protein [Rhodospirillales bacterium]